MKAPRSSPGTIKPAREPTGKRRGATESPQVRMPVQWHWHYRVLLALRDRLIKDRDDQMAEAAAPVERYGTHMGDSGSDEFDHDRALGLLAQEQDRLLEIDAAIQRILDGTYGICEETGKPIPDARLRAVPWTRYAKKVEERLEHQGLAKEPPLPVIATFHSPPCRRAREDELMTVDEDLDDTELGEEPELITLAAPPNQRMDVIEALERGVEVESANPGDPLAATRAMSADEPVSTTEL